MKSSSHAIGAILSSAAAAILIIGAVYAQQPPQPATQPQPTAAPRGGRGGRGARGIPNATPAQTAAIARMNADLAPLLQNLAAARKELLTAALAIPRDNAALIARVDAVRHADEALATARADALEKLQASSDRLNQAQLDALANMSIPPRAPAGGAIPNLTSNQVAMLTEMTGSVQSPAQAVNDARAELTAAVFDQLRYTALVRTKAETLARLESDLAGARAEALAKIQSSPGALSAEQIQALVSAGGVLTSGGFSEPAPIDFNDHAGYVSLFDGVSLKGWDGNPKFWSVVDGAIVGESTPQNPSGNTYIVYRDVEAHDFTLKCEIKVEGSGGSGIQYRSKTGIPWLTAIAPNVTANVGPVNLAWMMTGPQADFWPVRVYSGQVYSENTPMRIEAYRGQVVEQAGMAGRKLMGNIGDRIELGKIVKMNDWNQYTVIARGPSVIQIINGQMMAALVDDDPTSSNNESGLFGIEMEATTRVSARNIWLKKLN